jgi:hypothetical protein
MKKSPLGARFCSTPTFDGSVAAMASKASAVMVMRIIGAGADFCLPAPASEPAGGLFDGFVDDGVQALSREPVECFHRRPLRAALAKVRVKTAYLDGELCGVGDDGLPSFSQTQAASDGERGVRLVYYAFDLLHLDAGTPLLFNHRTVATLDTHA